MTRDAIIENVSRIINEALAAGSPPDEASLHQWRDQDPALVAQILEAYHNAAHPTDFYNVPMWRIDDRFEQAYELLRLTFPAHKLEARDVFVGWLGSLAAPPDDFVMIGRFWRVSGRQTYTPDGTLHHFVFDPLTSTESIASVIIGDYASLGNGTGFGAIGYLATRPALRGGRGHGSALSMAFETAVAAWANKHGERLRCIVLEAEYRARFYWAKQGYRYPRGSVYITPSLTFDPVTGEPTGSETVDELMLKFMDGSSPTDIARDELLVLVRTLYDTWYIPELADPTAAAKAAHYIREIVYRRFVDSVVSDPVELIWPPDAIS